MSRPLTEQERAVLRLHGAGRSAKEIACELGMSEVTVAWIVGQLVRERGARTAAALADTLARTSDEVMPKRAFAPRFAIPLAVLALAATASLAAAMGALHRQDAVPLATATASSETLPPSTRVPGGGVLPPTIASPTPTVTPDPATASAAPASPTLMPSLPTTAPMTLPPPLPTLPASLPTLPRALPTAPPLPTLTSPLPTLTTPRPTITPSPSVPLPPLPTVPPLPTRPPQL